MEQSVIEIMALTKQAKTRATKDFKRHDKDSGSAEYQISLFTAKIKKLTSHLKKNPKDKHSRKGLLGMVQQRKKLQKHLKNKSEVAYNKLIKKLGIKG